jgi:predicted DNA-binding transcriptional regulator AlpA
LSTGERRHPGVGGHADHAVVARRGLDGGSGGWLSLEEFCEELGVPRSTAYKWCAAGPASGKFPRYRRLPNGRLRIRRDWLEQWLDGFPTG